MRIIEDRHVHDFIFFVVTFIYVLIPWPFSSANLFNVWRDPKKYADSAIGIDAYPVKERSRICRSEKYHLYINFYSERMRWAKINVRASLWRFLWILAFFAIIAGWNVYNINFELDHDHPEGEVSTLHAAMEDSDYMTVNGSVFISVLLTKFISGTLEYNTADSHVAPVALMIIFTCIVFALVTSVFLWIQEAWIFFALWLLLPATLIYTLWILYIINVRYTMDVTSVQGPIDPQPSEGAKKHKKVTQPSPENYDSV